jgi:aromatic-L-amino-acid decarboxylase
MTKDTQEHPFTQDLRDFTRLAHRTIDAIVAQQQKWPHMAVDNAIPPREQRDYLANMELPSEGISAGEILDVLEQRIMPWPMPTTHRRSYGWINPPAAPISVLADTVSTALNMGLDGYDHPSIFLMKSLGRWLMELSGFPQDGSMALLFTGGSAANLNALTVARYKAAKQDGWNIREEGLQGNRPAFTLYTSAEAHSSIQRCAEQLGLGRKALRKVACDNDFRLNPEALREAISTDIAAGLRPFCVVATSGSTNTGAIDPLSDIADICDEFSLWMHVDGAYGGIGGLDPAYTGALKGLDRANSLTLDPHKWLQVPFDCGALLVREPKLNRENFLLVPDYLQEAEAEAEDGSVPWPSEYMFQLTYGNRVLKTWASIARLGRKGVAELVTRCNRVASHLGQLVEAAPDMELQSPVSLSVVNFRYVPEGATVDAVEIDALNEKISAAISASGEAHVPTSRVNGAVSLRACFLHYENDEDDAHHLVELTRRLALNILTESNSD